MELLSKRKKETRLVLIELLKMIPRRRKRRRKSRKPMMHSVTLAISGAMTRKIMEEFKRKRRQMEMTGEPSVRQMMMRTRERMLNKTKKKTRMMEMILEDLMTSKTDKRKSKQLLNLWQALIRKSCQKNWR